jgi:hypothetical protein
MARLEDLKDTVDEENYRVMKLLSDTFDALEKLVHDDTGKKLEFIYLGRLSQQSHVGQMFANICSKTAEQVLLNALCMVEAAMYPDENPYDRMEQAVESWVDERFEDNASTRH